MKTTKEIKLLLAYSKGDIRNPITLKDTHYSVNDLLALEDKGYVQKIHWMADTKASAFFVSPKALNFFDERRQRWIGFIVAHIVDFLLGFLSGVLVGLFTAHLI